MQPFILIATDPKELAQERELQAAALRADELLARLEFERQMRLRSVRRPAKRMPNLANSY